MLKFMIAYLSFTIGLIPKNSLLLNPTLPRTVTYSPSFTLVPTYECFNRCSYCNFRQDHGADWITPEKTCELLVPLVGTGVIEILVLSGEVHPKDPRRRAWLEMLLETCKIALSLGFLPHTNAGILSYAEMQALAEVNSSMGLMLEQMVPLEVHQHAPSKVPEVRAQQLHWAGALKIPFTTGVLLGIGETLDDTLQTLETIQAAHQKYGHIQEVILQPHQPGGQQVWAGESFQDRDLLKLVSLARSILAQDIVLQIPPNLVRELGPFLDAGVTDLGGIGPVDVVNPDYDHPLPDDLAVQLEANHWNLVRRLPVYAQHYSWVKPQVQPVLQRWLRNPTISGKSSGESQENYRTQWTEPSR
jgi:7,8-didemethyl-8-hydroxy-5-deazariboflavin synthase